jgi:hypothetical protein
VGECQEISMVTARGSLDRGGVSLYSIQNETRDNIRNFDNVGCRR